MLRTAGDFSKANRSAAAVALVINQPRRLSGSITQQPPFCGNFFVVAASAQGSRDLLSHFPRYGILMLLRSWVWQRRGMRPWCRTRSWHRCRRRWRPNRPQETEHLIRLQWAANASRSKVPSGADTEPSRRVLPGCWRIGLHGAAGPSPTGRLGPHSCGPAPTTNRCRK